MNGRCALVDAPLDRTHRVGLLWDAYSNLLTERQRQAVRLHYLLDYSLGEIAARLNISRQAVHDLLQRAVGSMEDYEARLGLVQQRLESDHAARLARALLGDMRSALRSLATEAEGRQDHRLLEDKLTALEELIETLPGRNPPEGEHEAGTPGVARQGGDEPSGI